MSHGGAGRNGRQQGQSLWLCLLAGTWCLLEYTVLHRLHCTVSVTDLSGNELGGTN